MLTMGFFSAISACMMESRQSGLISSGRITRLESSSRRRFQTAPPMAFFDPSAASCSFLSLQPLLRCVFLRYHMNVTISLLLLVEEINCRNLISFFFHQLCPNEKKKHAIVGCLCLFVQLNYLSLDCPMMSRLLLS